MKNIEWLEAAPNDNGIDTIAFEDLGKYLPNIGRIVGYNSILKGERVLFNNEEWIVVMVSRLGYLGLSKTGSLPYVKTALPTQLIRI
ncbi:hypothetical protein [Viridibacillus arvi]|uniref:hypothetical protein n=1 Tax=Viridibacillus arvi TaxID=263475 RepID=UPI0034CEC468